MQWAHLENLSDESMTLAIATAEGDAASISVEKFSREQAESLYCCVVTESAGDPASKFYDDQYGFLVCRSTLTGTLQRIVSKRLRARILYLTPYRRLSGNPGGTRMYHRLRRA